jgi:predicted nucleic acid-binding protein
VILPDVNVLVYALRREAEQHQRYAARLSQMVAGEEELALHDIATADRGFARFPSIRTFDPAT